MGGQIYKQVEEGITKFIDRFDKSKTEDGQKPSRKGQKR
jgi:hypothetical protein